MAVLYINSKALDISHISFDLYISRTYICIYVCISTFHILTSKTPYLILLVNKTFTLSDNISI